MSLIFALPVLGLALSGLLSWGPAILMIGGLIFIHEAGHFTVAKWMGMPVEVFSLGFGPRLVGFKWRETDVRLSILPLGGYVKLLGFNPEEPEAEDPHGFLKQPVWKRQLFYAGGILFNVATTLVLFFILSTDRARSTALPVPSTLLVTSVVPGSAAEQAGLRPGDEIEAMGELRFPGGSNDQAVAYIQARPSQTLAMTLKRGTESLQMQVTPREEGGKGRLGVAFGPSQVNYIRRPLRLSDFGTGALDSMRLTAGSAAQVFNGYVRLLTFRAKMNEVGGPIAIAKMGQEAAKAGWVVYLAMTAMISMNLAILNALPIPFLDGGHMALLAFERMRRRELSVAVKERILTGGFVLLASLMALVLAMDVWRLRH